MNKKTKKKIMITGGHLTPAIATIEELRTRHPDWELVFVGRNIALEGSNVVSEEYRVIAKMGIVFLPLTAGRMRRDFSLLALWAMLKIPVGFVQALGYLLIHRPDVIMSFGGYVALPVVLMGWILGIPTVTHEQTTRPGIANRIIARFAKRICVSFPEEVSAFGKRSLFTGLPMRLGTFSPPKKAPFVFDRNLPLLFITGGSTGSVSINSVVSAALPHLVAEYNVVHQVGRLSYEKETPLQLSAADRGRYIAVPYLSESAYSWTLAQSDIVIGRAGANTVLEIAALGKTALFIPLPWASRNEQYYNAKYLVDQGTSLLIKQSEFNEATLLQAVHTLMAKKEQFRRSARALAQKIPRNGAEKLVDALSDI